LTVYADTSFFISIYVEDAHSKTAEQLIDSQARVWFTPLHHAECANAVAQQIFHKLLAASDAQRAYQQLEKDRATGLWLEVDLPDDVFDVCADLARRHGPRLGVRTLESLHVACALRLKSEEFWTFDQRQAKLAKAVGLKIF
jgi:predicted nucleic acid-binding protein